MSMKPHFLAGLAVLMALFTCITVVCADSGQWYLLTPRMVIRMNLTDSPIVRDIGVRNTDVEPVDVAVSPGASLSSIVSFNATDLNFTLFPNETRRINFTITPAEAGNYSGDVMVLFTARNPNVTNGALASEIYVFVGGEALNSTGGTTPTQGVNAYAYAAIAAAIAIIAGAIIIIRRRS